MGNEVRGTPTGGLRGHVLAAPWVYAWYLLISAVAAWDEGNSPRGAAGS